MGTICFSQLSQCLKKFFKNQFVIRDIFFNFVNSLIQIIIWNFKWCFPPFFMAQTRQWLFFLRRGYPVQNRHWSHMILNGTSCYRPSRYPGLVNPLKIMLFFSQHIFLRACGPQAHRALSHHTSDKPLNIEVLRPGICTLPRFSFYMCNILIIYMLCAGLNLEVFFPTPIF